jgi:hypothetical protein
MIDQEKAKVPGMREQILRINQDGATFQDYLMLKEARVWIGGEECCLDWKNFEQWVKYTAKVLETEESGQMITKVP